MTSSKFQQKGYPDNISATDLDELYVTVLQAAKTYKDPKYNEVARRRTQIRFAPQEAYEYLINYVEEVASQEVYNIFIDYMNQKFTPVKPSSPVRITSPTRVTNPTRVSSPQPIIPSFRPEDYIDREMAEAEEAEYIARIAEEEEEERKASRAPMRVGSAAPLYTINTELYMPIHEIKDTIMGLTPEQIRAMYVELYGDEYISNDMMLEDILDTDIDVLTVGLTEMIDTAPDTLQSMANALFRFGINIYRKNDEPTRPPVYSPVRRATSPIVQPRVQPRVVTAPVEKDILINVLNLMAANLNIDLRYFLVSWLDLKQNEAFILMDEEESLADVLNTREKVIRAIDGLKTQPDTNWLVDLAEMLKINVGRFIAHPSASSINAPRNMPRSSPKKEPLYFPKYEPHYVPTISSPKAKVSQTVTRPPSGKPTLSRPISRPPPTASSSQTAGSIATSSRLSSRPVRTVLQFNEESQASSSQTSRPSASVSRVVNRPSSSVITTNRYTRK